MKARNIITTLALCIAFGSSSIAQQQPSLATQGGSYNTAIGLRAGYTSGLTIKKFVAGSAAIEGIIGFWHHGLSATVLYERHVNAFGVNGFNWYYGGGGHASIHNNQYYGTYFGRSPYYDDGALGLGVDGILGLEYKIPAIPFALSLDIKPFVEVNTAGGVGFAFDSGLGIKVCF